MLIGRRNKENSAGVLNSALDLLPKRKSIGTKLAETPQKLKAEILCKNREIEQLRRLLDQANKTGSGLSSPRQQLFSCDCQDRFRVAFKKVEECIHVIRQHNWSENDRVCSQDALDLLQAGLALFFAPSMTKARISRRHSMTSNVSTDDFSEDGSESRQIQELKQKLAEYSTKLDASRKHEQEIEAVVAKLGEACRLSEARAGEYQAKSETLHSSLISERKNAASLLVRVQEAEDGRLSLQEDVIRLQDELARLQTDLKQSRKTNEQAHGALIEMKIMTGKIEKLTRELSREKEYNEVQAQTLERLEQENLNLTKSVAERDERIRHLVCSSYKEKETEREALLNRINIANTAVSTLQLELQLKQQQAGEDSDDEGDVSEEVPLTLYQSPKRTSHELPSAAKLKIVQECSDDDEYQDSDDQETIILQEPNRQRGIPLFLLSNQL